MKNSKSKTFQYFISALHIVIIMFFCNISSAKSDTLNTLDAPNTQDINNIKEKLDINSNSNTCNNQKIISLSPEITEIIIALGCAENIVANDAMSKELHLFKNTQQHKSNLDNIVSDYYSINLEKIILTKPDVIIINNDFSRRYIDKFNKSSLNVKILNFKNLNDLYHNINVISDILGVTEIGNKLQNSISNTILNLQQKYNSQPSVQAINNEQNLPNDSSLNYVQQNQKKIAIMIMDKPLIMVGSNNFINDAIQLCGATNVIKDSIAPYPQVSLEHILKVNPDMIISTHSNTNNLSPLIKSKVIYTKELESLARLSPQTFLNTLPLLCDIINKEK